MANKYTVEIFTFFDFGHLQWETGDQSLTKKGNFGYIPFSQKLDFFKDCKNSILSRWILCHKISSKSDNIWVSKGWFPPLKGPFHGCWISTNVNHKCYADKISDYVLYIKIMYFYKTFNLAKNCGVTQGVRGYKQKTSYNKPENQFFWLNFY